MLITLMLQYIENNTWCAEIPDLFRVLNVISVYRDITREINLVFPSTHVLFCLLYKLQSFLPI